MALANYNDSEIEQTNVVAAFLNAEVESNIYMEEPQGFGTTVADETRLFYHSKKALYGIREAPKAWNALLTSWLISYGFTQSLVDPGVFVNVVFIEKLIYILDVYVDDSTLTRKAGKLFTDFKAAFSERFEIEDLGPTSWLLGCMIDNDREKRIFRLSQDQYVSKIIEEFGMGSSTPVGTPIATNAISKS
jgi:hypothetical protein